MAPVADDAEKEQEQEVDPGDRHPGERRADGAERDRAGDLPCDEHDVRRLLDLPRGDHEERVADAAAERDELPRTERREPVRRRTKRDDDADETDETALQRYGPTFSRRSSAESAVT